MTGKDISCKAVFGYIVISVICSGIINRPKQAIQADLKHLILCMNVAFFYNRFHEPLPILMTSTRGSSPVAAYFECKHVRMCLFANFIYDY